MARLGFIGSERRNSGKKNPPPTFRWPKDGLVGSYRKTQLAYTLASQTLRQRSFTEPARIKHPAPVVLLAGPTRRGPFTVVPPPPSSAVHSFRTITGAIGAGSRSRTGRQDSATYPGSKVITHTKACTVPLWQSGTTSHRYRRLLRNANRPPKRILPCACATNPGLGPFLRPKRLRKTEHRSLHYAGAYEPRIPLPPAISRVPDSRRNFVLRRRKLAIFITHALYSWE